MSGFRSDGPDSPAAVNEITVIEKLSVFSHLRGLDARLVVLRDQASGSFSWWYWRPGVGWARGNETADPIGVSERILTQGV